VRLSVELLGQRSGAARPAVVTDLSLAGAGLETDDPLLPGERVAITLSTPTMWDPLVIEAVVAWAHPPRPSMEVDAIGRSRTVARAGVVFDYPTPATVLALFEMLATLGYE
jgi:PilZ domain